MQNLTRFAAFALMLLPATGAAQDYEAGLAAAQAGDYATARNEWTPLAEAGDSRAQRNLGLMYEHGDGVQQDFAEAVRWYRAAAEQGDPWAQTILGRIYGIGQGVPQDFISAHMWFNISSANGEADASDKRDKAALKLLPADISEAQRRAKVCMASNYQDCD